MTEKVLLLAARGAAQPPANFDHFDAIDLVAGPPAGSSQAA